MDTKLIRIGNSSGVIIPKQILKNYEAVSFSIVEDAGNIVLIPQSKKTTARKGWEQAFEQNTREHEPEGDLFDNAPNHFDEEEWEW